jgi:hypothetical protein
MLLLKKNFWIKKNYHNKIKNINEKKIHLSLIVLIVVFLTNIYFYNYLFD